MNEKTHWTPLSDLARVLRAPLVKTEGGSTHPPFRVISIKDFPPAGYLLKPEREVSPGALIKIARKYIVRPYDVLVTISGTIGQVTIVPPQCGQNWIPASNIFLVRFEDDEDGIKSRTFYGLMKSSFGQDLLESLAHGSGIQIVSKKAFSATLIPPFTGEYMEKFERLWHQERELYERSKKLMEDARQIFTVAAESDSVVAQKRKTVRSYPALGIISFFAQSSFRSSYLRGKPTIR